MSKPSYHYGAERQPCAGCSNLTLRTRVSPLGTTAPECFDCSLLKVEEANRRLAEALADLRQLAEQTRDRMA